MTNTNKPQTRPPLPAGRNRWRRPAIVSPQLGSTHHSITTFRTPPLPAPLMAHRHLAPGCRTGRPCKPKPPSHLPATLQNHLPPPRLVHHPPSTTLTIVFAPGHKAAQLCHRCCNIMLPACVLACPCLQPSWPAGQPPCLAHGHAGLAASRSCRPSAHRPACQCVRPPIRPPTLPLSASLLTPDAHPSRLTPNLHAGVPPAHSPQRPPILVQVDLLNGPGGRLPAVRVLGGRLAVEAAGAKGSAAAAVAAAIICHTRRGSYVLCKSKRRHQCKRAVKDKLEHSTSVQAKNTVQ